jgi:RNA polymerase sigma factor (sigma-70 family)
MSGNAIPSMDATALVARADVDVSSANAAHWHGIDLPWAYSLLPFIARRTSCAECAQDVLHEALLRYVLRRGGVIEQPHAYLRRVINSVLADSAQDARRYQPLPPEHQLSLQGLTALSAQQVAELHEHLRQVQQVLAMLPPRACQVFWLFRIEGWKQQEIAQMLGISRNMVERHVMRALVDLRALQKYCPPT